MIYQSDLMKEIIAKKEGKEISALSAEINGDYIVPGINGIIINELDSYYRMKSNYKYTFSKLVFEQVSPDTSLHQNKNLIIEKGNLLKRGVSIIIDDNPKIKDYIIKNKINAAILINLEEFDKNSTLLQINVDEDLKALDGLLDKYKINENICFINKIDKEKCIKQNKFLVKSTYSVDNINIVGLEIYSGDIIFIDNTLSLENFKILLKKILYRNIDILKLSDLISEQRLT